MGLHFEFVSWNALFRLLAIVGHFVPPLVHNTQCVSYIPDDGVQIAPMITIHRMGFFAHVFFTLPMMTQIVLITIVMFLFTLPFQILHRHILFLWQQLNISTSVQLEYPTSWSTFETILLAWQVTSTLFLGPLGSVSDLVKMCV